MAANTSLSSEMGLAELPALAEGGGMRLLRGPALHIHLEIQALPILHPEIYESFCFNACTLAYPHWPKGTFKQLHLSVCHFP